ncbi:MAG: ribose-phosphate pyrophosphokinase [Candidatus Liptonbacteria bacterium]|nr:ribose-phosphate pyrophosphokinase [Candidatus Liptonbacteria bacterium]
MLLVSPNFSDLFAPNVEIKKFPDGESYVRIPDLGACEDRPITLLHRLYPEQNNSLLELLLIIDELAHKKCDVAVLSPYLPYSRQDKNILKGEIAGGKVVCNLLARTGCKIFITIDCHFLKGTGDFTHGELPIRNISMAKPLTDYAREKIFKDEAFEVIGPDQGASYLVEHAGGTALTKVRRGYKGGAIIYRDVETLEGDIEVRGKNVLILDDMISTGNTMIKTVEWAREAGAEKIACAATHGLFLGNSLDKLETISDAVFTTDSILNPAAKVSIKEQLDEHFQSLFSAE